MATSNYDTNKLSNALNNVSVLEKKVSSLIDDIEKTDSLDKRIIEYYNSETNYFNDINSSKSDLNTSLQELSSFKSWLDGSIASLETTIDKTEKKSNEAQEFNGNSNYNPITSTAPVAAATTESALDSDVDSSAHDSNDAEKPDEETLKDDLDNHLHESTDPDNPEYRISKEDWDRLTPEEQEAIKAKLKEAGYTDDEINKIITGSIGVSSVLLSATSKLLESAIKENPDVRNYILEKYGIDVFDENGNVDLSRLALILMVDMKSEDFNLIGDLASVYGIKINDENIDQIASLLEHAIEENPQLRQLIIDKYGFDIFNEDGTINIEKLKMLLLMDGFNSSDSLDILKILQQELNIDTLELNNINETAKLLEELLALNPELRDALIEKYGFDIFNEDGTINYDKLRLALMLDEINGEQTTLLNLLSEKYDFYIPTEDEVDAYSIFLAKLLGQNPDLKDIFMEKYGFDIFNEDGTINLEKLKLALMLDNISMEDDFDILDLLSKKYGLEIPTMDELNKFKDLLNTVLLTDDNFREALIKRYGFDIFNEDGTVNMDKLRLALMMDQMIEDDFDLYKYLMNIKNRYNVETNTNSNTTDIEKTNIESNTNSNSKSYKKHSNNVSKVKINKLSTNNKSNTKTVDVKDISLDNINDIDTNNNEVLEEENIIPEEPIIEDYTEPGLSDDAFSYTSMEIVNEDGEIKQNTKKKSNLLGIAAGIGLAAGTLAYGTHKILKKKEEEDEEDSEYKYEYEDGE